MYGVDVFAEVSNNTPHGFVASRCNVDINLIHAKLGYETGLLIKYFLDFSYFIFMFVNSK